MPTRSRESFQKRQKELQRMEKQRDKAARRLARKSAPKEPDVDSGAEPESSDDSGPSDE